MPLAQMTCPECSGSGFIEGDEANKCQGCNGTGYVPDNDPGFDPAVREYEANDNPDSTDGDA